MPNPHLKRMYTGENALQAITATAARIENETGISVIRAHLGNPTAPQFEKTNQIVADYYRTRSENSESRGYADVVGPASWRQHIATSLNYINRLPPGTLDKDNIRGVVGGTGALNIAFQIFDQPTILVSEPFYPPWMEIGHHTKERIETFPLRAEDDYLLNPSILEHKIREVTKRVGDKPVVLTYHYPHNPSGKTLNEAEARHMGEVLSALCKRHPNFYLVQEDLYLATTAPECGIYTPLPYLDDNARSRTLWLHSPSKMGHAQDRGAVIAAFDKEILHHLRGCISFDQLGASHPSLLATAHTLAEIAYGGVGAISDAGARPDNYRYKTAQYYQDRMKIVAGGIGQIEEKLGVEILPGGAPQGAYYLYPSFACFKGKPVPEALKPVFAGKKTFENADDVTLALQNAHLLGLQPVTVASGTLFTKDPETMHVRFAAIEPDIGKMKDAVNTLLGLTENVVDVKLGAYFHTPEELLAHHGAKAAETMAMKFVAGGSEQKGFSIRF